METFYPCIDHAVPDVSGLSWPFPFPRPQPIKINGVLLVGDKSSEELHLASAEDMKQVQQEVSGMGEQITRAVEAATAAEQAAREATEAAETATQTANEAKKAAEGKADADDLPYALTEAYLVGSLPEGVTVLYEGSDVTEEFKVERMETRWVVVRPSVNGEWDLEGVPDSGSFYNFTFKSGDSEIEPPNLVITNKPLTNRAINTVAVASGDTSIALTLPDEIEAHSRNLSVRIDLSTWYGDYVPIVTFQNYDGTLPVTEAKGGTWPALVAFKDNLISLKEVAAGIFTVEATAYERISPPTP